MDQQPVPLKWGDIVRIHGVNSYTKSIAKGLIISKGFTDQNIYYQTYEQFDEVNFYRESLFQIIPKTNFDIHDQLLQEELSEEDKIALSTRAEGQIIALEGVLDSKKGKEITFGQEVIFRHVESKAYLQGLFKAADVGEGAFKIQITDQLSSFVIFKVQSHRSYDSEDDVIYFDDVLQIYHPASDTFMNYDERNNPIALDTREELEEIPEGHPFREFSDKRPSIKRPLGNRISIINENKSKCLWKFIQHCTCEEYNNISKIKSHDIVYFQHTKKNEESLISTTISEPLAPYLKQTEHGSLPYDCFWELIPEEVNELGPQSCNSFWARNICTGQLLKYEDFNVEIKSNKQGEQGEDTGYDNHGLVNLICSKAQDQSNSESYKLERGEIIHTDQGISKIVEQYEKKFKKISFTKVKKLPKDIFMIQKVEEEKMSDALYVLSAHQPLVKFVEKLASGLLNQDTEGFHYPTFFFSLNEDSLENIINILKLLTAKIYGVDYEKIVSSGNTPNLNVQKVLVEMGITQILMEIINYLYKPFIFIQSQTQPSKDRSIRLKIVKIFQLTYQLLQKIVVGCEDNRIFLSRWIDLFLQHSNGANKNYIQECLVGILQNNPMSINATITSEKIQTLIECFLTEARQAEEKGEELSTKYLRLFSTFIKCEDTVIKQNQNIILNKFFKNPQNQFNFRIKSQYKSEGIYDDENDPFKVKSREAQVSLGKGQYCTLTEFYNKHPTKWNYFLSYMDLLSDVCRLRNNFAIETVSNFISLQSVSVILFDNEVAKLQTKIKQINQESFPEVRYPIENIHAPFVRIAHHVYVNNEKFQPIKRIKKISRWYRFQEGEKGSERVVQDINRTKRVFEGEKEQEEERHLQSLLEYIKVYVKNCNQDARNLEMLKIVLDLLKQTITLGLWRSIKFFRELSPLLVTKIAKIEPQIFFDEQLKEGVQPPKNSNKGDLVQNNKNKLKLNRPEIAKAIQCKIIVTEIYREMNELEIDIRLRYVMNFFKGLYDATEDFNIYDKPLEEDPEVDEEDQESKKIQERNETAKDQYNKMDGKALFGDSIPKVTEDVDVLLNQNLWYHKLQELTPFRHHHTEDPMKDRYMFQGERSPDEEPIDPEEQFNNLVLALFQLSVYSNYRLLNSSLNMLRTMFEQRKDLLDNFNKILICGKGNMQEVYLTLKFMRGKFKMLTNSNILKYQGDSDKSFTYEIKQPYKYLEKDRQKRSGIIEDLFFLARTLKDGISLKNIQSLMHVDDDVFARGEVYVFMDERQKNNELFQSLNLAQGIYIPLIQYIKITNTVENLGQIHRKLLLSIYQYLTLLCFNNLEAKQILMPFIPDILPHLPKAVGAASFLYEVTRNNKLLVQNEEVVKLIIQKALESCNELVRDYNSVGDQYLIKSLTDPNEEVKLKNANVRDYEIPRIFFALRGIILYNDRGHKQNQELLMNRLQDKKYKHLIFTEDTNCVSKIRDFNLEPRDAYIAHHFELFSLLVESGNLINIGKLENTHPYEQCLRMLKGTNRWQVRRSIRAYINRLYYVNKDKEIFLFQNFIREEFGILNKEIGEFLSLYKSRHLTQDLKIKNGIRFIYAQSQIFLFIIECLISLHEIFLKDKFIEILMRELKKQERVEEEKRLLHQKLIQLFKNLGCLKKIYDKIKIIDPFLKEIKKLMKKQLMTFPIRYLEKKSEPDEGAKTQVDISQPVEEQGVQKSFMQEKNTYSYDSTKSFFRNLHDMIKFQKYKQNMDKLKDLVQSQKNDVNVPEQEMKSRYLERIFQVAYEKLKTYYVRKQTKKALHYDPHLQTANSRTFRLLAQKGFQENEQNVVLNNKLTSVKKLVQDSPIFDKFKDDQFVFLVHKVMELNDTSIALYKPLWEEHKENPKPVINIHEIISQTFQLIMSHPDKIEDREKIFVLKFVRFYMTEAVEQKQSYKLSVDKWEPDYCSENKQFQARQQQVQDCGGSDFLISILKENLTGRVELLNEALLLGIAYLFGGNKVCQNSILSSLKKDGGNQMLLSLRHLIKYIGDFLINVRKIKQNQKSRDFNYNIVDTYDYFSNDDKMILRYFGQTKLDKFQIQTELNYEKALCRIFRFLQLFAESNNQDMKKFLTEQINDDGSKKRNSINFIDEACLLLKKLFKVMNHKLVMLPKNLLDFIGEITQVPILVNQKLFIKSTFFEDLSYMASFFATPSNKQARKFNKVPEEEDDPLNQLEQIYIQGVGLALNNFEGNDHLIVKQFLSKCQPKFLWLVTRGQLWSLIKQKYLPAQNLEGEGEIDDHELMLKTFMELDKETFQKMIHEQKKQPTFENQMANIIQVRIILKKIGDYEAAKRLIAEADKEKINEDDSKDAKSALKFLMDFRHISEDQCPEFSQISIFIDELIYQIEINCHNGQSDKLQYIYFPNHPVFSYLASDTKDRIMVQVKRETSRDKLISLLGFRQEVYDEIQWNYEKDHNGIDFAGFHLNMSVTSDLYTKIRIGARNCSYLICVLMFYMVFVEHDMEDQQNKTSMFILRKFYQKIIMRLLCAIQLGLSVFYFFLWYNMRGSLAVKKHLSQDEEEGQEEEQQELGNRPPLGFDLLKWYYEIFARKLFKLKNFILGKYYQSSLYKSILLPIWAIYNIEPEFLSIALFLTTAFMGNFVGIEWYTVHLFDFFVGIPMLANVFKALIQNIRVLTILSALATAFVLVFNVLSLSTYVPVIYEEELPEQSCSGIIECVLTVYTSGAIGDDMDEFMFGRFIFDIIYVVFMELLFQNLVGGIIIDCYSALVAEDDNRESDKKGQCYICSMSKANIQKSGTTFTKHTEKHFLWNYLYYIYCLKKKDQTEYTGIEYIISEQIGDDNVNWFPALGDADTGVDIEGLMDQLKEKVDQMAKMNERVIEKTNSIFEDSGRMLKKIKSAEPQQNE